MTAIIDSIKHRFHRDIVGNPVTHGWVLNLYRAGMYYESRGLLGRAKELYQRALSVAPLDEKVLSAYVRVAPNHGFAIIPRVDPQAPRGVENLSIP